MMCNLRHEIKLKLKRLLNIFHKEDIPPVGKKKITPFYVPKNNEFTDPYSPIKRKRK